MRIAVGSGLAAALLLPAAAQTEIVQAEPGRFVCEAAAGQQEQADVSAFFRGNVMSAAVQIISADGDEQMYSSAGLAFIYPDGKAVALLVIANDNDGRRMWVGLTHPGNDRIVHLGSLRRARNAQIMMQIDANGILHVQGGTIAAQVDVGTRPPAQRRVVCSSGRFQIQLTRPPGR
jgi:hypothetical protein